MINKLHRAGFTLTESLFIQQILEESPFISFSSREEAQKFADAAIVAGHKTVHVSSVKGRVGVLLGTMSHEDAGELLQRLNTYYSRPE